MLEDDERWINFVLLLDIVDRILAPIASLSVVADLIHLIETHHLEFSRLYPDKSLPPKWHFIVHYPQLIQRSHYINMMYVRIQYITSVYAQVWTSFTALVYEVRSQK